MSRFRWITDPLEAERPDFDLPVRESRHFVVLPTLGALVEDWLLIVPRRMMANLSFLTEVESGELKALIQSLSKQLRSEGHQVFSFEHGAHFESVLGCGVDQAHLHLAPLQFDLLKAATQTPDVNWQEVDSNHSSTVPSQSREYLWVANSLGEAAIGFPQRPTSQWFRKLIATKLGRPEAWDYRTHPYLDNLRNTASHFAYAHD